MASNGNKRSNGSVCLADFIDPPQFGEINSTSTTKMHGNHWDPSMTVGVRKRPENGSIEQSRWGGENASNKRCSLVSCWFTRLLAGSSVLAVGSFALFFTGCEGGLDQAVPLAEIKTPHPVAVHPWSSQGERIGSDPTALVSRLKAPALSDLLSDLPACSSDSAGLKKTASPGFGEEIASTARWTIESDFSLTASIEALQVKESQAKKSLARGSLAEADAITELKKPAMQLVQDGAAPQAIPELIPTPKGKPDPDWKEKLPVAPAKGMPAKGKVPANPPSGNPTQPAVQAEAASSAMIKVAEANRMKKDGTNAAGDLLKIPSSAELGEQPEDYLTWEPPTVALVFTGNQHGYIEPCGCTGLERQKGGVARRFTFLESLRERGWVLMPMDVGNHVRRFGRQAEIKLQQSVRALSEMQYQAVGFGPEDIRLGAGELLSVAAGESPEDTMYVSANVVLIDPELMPQQKVILSNGLKVGVTSILDPASLETDPGEELLIEEMVASAKSSIEKLEAESPDYNVLLFYGEEKSARSLVQDVDGFDLIVVAGGYGEPTYQANAIEGSKTKIIVTGKKGMYAGIVGLFDQDASVLEGDHESPKSAREEPTGSSPNIAMRYARVPLTHEFGDAPAMRVLMKDYQDQLRDVGLGKLGLLPPIPHPSGHKFVGAQACGKCHTEAMDVWESSAHAQATESIIEPPEDRGDVARHFDPECISCHVTGWNAQSYYPYASGYLSLESTAHLKGNGCENCHGPGAEHSAAEEKGSGMSQKIRDQLRLAMRLPLEKAREKCMECHDLDNSPDFHDPDAFEDIYWPEVEHSGLE